MFIFVHVTITIERNASHHWNEITIYGSGYIP